MNKKNEDEDEEKGYVHIYTGDGKGKTTAAFGLAVRALMAGKRVFIGQFVKSMKYHETKLEEYLEGLTIKQYGNGCFIYKNEPTQEDKTMAVEGLAEIERLLAAQSKTVDNKYDMIILDEVTIALRYKLLDIDRVVRVIRERNPSVEVVLTGRGAPEELIQIGDVVTEMRAIKHYYEEQGVLARDGIER
mmetsp:Transcript_48960/g.59052  ORF Transcript_48960/g.59052 Transcript_48960/m.59052 type:complete len:189 (-) Transcript_48960:45-611(-)